MPERKTTYLEPSYLARNATDVPRKKTIDSGGNHRVTYAKHYSDVDRF